jgi:ribonuclease P/MRP protein subunit POP1
MKIVEKWGVKLALSRNQRSFRFMYRTSQKEAALNDMSYCRVIELTGPEASLAALLDATADPTVANPACKKYLSGEREGRTMLHETYAYPAGAIAPVSFLWKALSDKSTSETRTVWIWVHISAYTQALDVFASAKKSMELGADVLINSLSKELIRFELTGPKSHEMLVKALHLTEREAVSHYTWKSLNTLESPAHLPPGTVLSLEINDPRLRFPVSKSPQTSEKVSKETLQELLQNWPVIDPTSDIWDQTAREQTSAQKSTEAVLNKRRQAHMIPGTPLEPLDTDPKIPILLINRTGIEGWVLIAPKGWAMSLWQSLVYSGARAGGLRDMHTFHFEQGLPHFPDDFPETQSGREELSVSTLLAKEVYERKPKAKRVNYESFDIDSPFGPDFSAISESKVVLHSARMAHYIQRSLHLPFKQMSETVFGDLSNLIKGRQCFPKLSLNPQYLENCFVRILLTVTQYGTIDHNAHIYFATPEILQLKPEKLLVCYLLI